MSIEKRRYDVPGLPPGWKREEVVRKFGLSAGRTDVLYYTPEGVKVQSKSELMRALSEKNIHLSSFDFHTGRIQPGALRKTLKQHLVKGAVSVTATGAVRPDASLVGPIRQTASIFKQPVTRVGNFRNTNTRSDLKHGPQDQPKQLFWEKRLQKLYATDSTGKRYRRLELPQTIQGTGPNMSTENLLQSIAASLHFSNKPITGQNVSRSALAKNPGVYVNSEQPHIQAVVITDQDIQRQELRVKDAQNGLKAALKAL